MWDIWEMMRLPSTMCVRLVYNGETMNKNKKLRDYGMFGLNQPELVQVVVVEEPVPWEVMDCEWD
jgi:hypothetical protein